MTPGEYSRPVSRRAPFGIVAGIAAAALLPAFAHAEPNNEFFGMGAVVDEAEQAEQLAADGLTGAFGK